MAGSVRQAARRSALEAQARLKAERAAREKRLSGLGVDVMVALGERDAAVGRCEEQAGAALRTMVDDEGLSLGEARQWCSENITRREVSRLVKVGAEQEPEGDDDADASAVGQR